MSRNASSRADRERVAIAQAWDDLSPEARACADDLCVIFTARYHGVGPNTSREILAALVRWEAKQHAA